MYHGCIETEYVYSVLQIFGYLALILANRFAVGIFRFLYL